MLITLRELLVCFKTVSSALVRIQSEGTRLKNKKLHGRSMMNQKKPRSREEETATLDLGFHHQYVMGRTLGTESNGSALELVVYSVKAWPFRHESLPLRFLGMRSKETEQCKHSRRPTSLDGLVCNSTCQCHPTEPSEKKSKAWGNVNHLPLNFLLETEFPALS